MFSGIVNIHYMLDVHCLGDMPASILAFLLAQEPVVVPHAATEAELVTFTGCRVVKPPRIVALARSFSLKN